MQLEKLSGIEIGKLVNNKEISPVEVIKYFGNRIEDKDSEINAFTYTMYDDAMAEAIQLEKRILDGEYGGVFAGVPIALKDFLPSKKGWQNSHGGVKSLIAIDDADSAFYAAARKLGAIAIGKTNAPAFGFSGACQNKLYGQTHNPFNIGHTSGGSSGGSAAAVAAGLVTFAEGGDAGGSIRIPSAWCNLFGYKPSLGTVPSYCRPDGWAATHPYCFNGVLTRSVLESATMLNAMAEYNPRDPISLPINSNKDFTKLSISKLNGKRIALTQDFNLYPDVDTEICHVVSECATNLKDLGAEVEEVNFNFKHSISEILFTWCWSISVDTALDIQHWLNNGLDLLGDHSDELPDEFIYFNELASKVGIRDMRLFNEIRTDILDNFEDIFENYDYIVSPVTICKPLSNEDNGEVKYVNRIRQSRDLAFIKFGETPLANFVGYPAASVPAGFTHDGFPVGMQIIGKQYHDEDVLNACYGVEVIRPWADKYELSM